MTARELATYIRRIQDPEDIAVVLDLLERLEKDVVCYPVTTYPWSTNKTDIIYTSNTTGVDLGQITYL